MEGYIRVDNCCKIAITALTYFPVAMTPTPTRLEAFTVCPGLVVRSFYL